MTLPPACTEKESPKRVRLSRVKGWRMPANTVKVDRTTLWGNPFHTHGDGVKMEPSLAVLLFTGMIEKCGGWTVRKNGLFVSITVEIVQRDLRGKHLACWCSLDAVCHADILLALANASSVAQTPMFLHSSKAVVNLTPQMTLN